MHNRIYTHLADTIRTTTDTDVLPAVASLLYLHRNHHTPTHHHHQEGHQEGQFQEDTLHPHDLGTLLRLATTAEGPASARTAAHWAAHHPEAFRLYRRTETGELVAFSTWLRLTEPDDHHLTADPIVAAAWTHARATTPLRAGEHLAISRLWVLPQHRDTSPVLDLIQSRIIGNCLRAERMAWSYIAIRRPNRAWTEHLQRYGMRTIPAQPRLDNTPYTLFVHDWRAVPAHTWLDRMNRLLLGRTTDTPDPTTSDLAVLSQTEFTEAVRKALRQLPRPGALATSPWPAPASSPTKHRRIRARHSATCSAKPSTTYAKTHAQPNSTEPCPSPSCTAPPPRNSPQNNSACPSPPTAATSPPASNASAPTSGTGNSTAPTCRRTSQPEWGEGTPARGSRTVSVASAGCERGARPRSAAGTPRRTWRGCRR
ncbi:hypothetical protein ACFQQB_62720 [Nonomuraea rubra]|uniref:hypothetical protein n=1 Tax=Nonomuraea rubra TaxID=46180 RepID=UPI003616E907